MENVLDFCKLQISEMLTNLNLVLCLSIESFEKLFINSSLPASACQNFSLLLRQNINSTSSDLYPKYGLSHARSMSLDEKSLKPLSRSFDRTSTRNSSFDSNESLFSVIVSGSSSSYSSDVGSLR